MKYFILALLIIATSITCSAQESKTDSHRYFGFRAGVTLSHPNFAKGSPPTDYESSWGAGFVGGLFLNVPISDKFSIQPEYLFRQMNSEMTDAQATLNLNYLSLPITVKYNLTQKLSLMAGPQFDLLIKGESQTNGETTSITHQTEERSIAANIGISYLVWKTVSIEAHYMHGLNHIGINQRDDVREFKFESLQFSAAFGF